MQIYLLNPNSLLAGLELELGLGLRGIYKSIISNIKTVEILIRFGWIYFN